MMNIVLCESYVKEVQTSLLPPIYLELHALCVMKESEFPVNHIYIGNNYVGNWAIIISMKYTTQLFT